MERKHFSFGAMTLLAAAMTSCSLDAPFEDLEKSSSTPASDIIGFQVQTSSMTRACDSYSNNLKPSSFMVSALDGADNYFGSVPEIVTSSDNGSTWSSANRLCWPKGKPQHWDGLSFYALIDGNDPDILQYTYGRAGSSRLDLTSSQPTLHNFSVDDDVRNHKDLMYAVAKNVKQTTSGGNVTLNFRHALSQICFTAQNCNPTLDNIEILSIELGGVIGNASYVFPDNSTQNVRAGYSGDNEYGQWVPAQGASERTFTISDLDIELGATDASGKGKVTNISRPSYSREGKTTSVSNLSNTMYMIPQTAVGRIFESDNAGAYVKVTVRKTPKGGVPAANPEVTFIPLDVSWKEGRSYTYDLTWKATAIAFSVTVADYSDVSMGDL